MAWVSSFDLSLSTVEELQIGQGTLDGFDLPARNSMYYSGGLIFILSLLLFSWLYGQLHLKWNKFTERKEWQYANSISAVGLMVLFSGLFGAKTFYTLEFIYLLHKLFLLLAVYGYLRNKQFELLAYISATLLAIALYFVVCTVYSIVGANHMPDVFLWVGIITATFLLLDRHHVLNTANVLHTLTPLLLAPLIYIISEEAYLVMKFKGIQDPGRAFPLFLMWSLVGIWMWIRKVRRTNLQAPMIIDRQWLPIFIFSITCYGVYNYTAEYGFFERFETGNKFLPLMEFMRFGTISPIEKFNTHLLSDYFFGLVYLVINGLQGNEMDIYDVLLYPFSALIYYFLFYLLTRHGLLSVFLTIVFPFGAQLMPIGFMMGLLPLFGFKLILDEGATRRGYFYFVLLILLTAVWRLEFTYAVATILPVFVWYVYKSGVSSLLNIRRVSISLGWGVLFVMVLIFALAHYRSVSISDRIQDVLHYLSSVQSYGMTRIGDPTSLSFIMHYRFFPIVVLLLIFVLLIPNIRQQKIKEHPWLVLSLLYLSLFYLANYQRGITRHSLQEGTDAFVSTYFYILVLFAPLLHSANFKGNYGLVYMGLMGTLLTANFSLPRPENPTSSLEKSLEKLANHNPSSIYQITDRVTKRPTASEDKMKVISEFFDRSLAKDETFIDFSNNPLLYFGVNKPTPGYFYQNPLCLHDRYLQKRFIEELKKVQTPFLVFSQYHWNQFDEVDGVPNILRHYTLAEYFYKYFEPFTLKGDFVVWKRKTHPLKLNNDTSCSENLNVAQTYSYTYIHQSFVQCHLKVPFNTTPTVKVNQTLQPLLQINDSLYICRLTQVDSVTIEIQGVKQVATITGEDEPDFTMQGLQALDMKKLPIVWGASDTSLLSLTPVIKRKVEQGRGMGIAYTVDSLKVMPYQGATLLLKVRNNHSKSGKMFAIFRKAGNSSQNYIAFDAPTKNEWTWLAVRMSVLYSWHQPSVNRIQVWSDDAGLTLGELRLVYDK